MLDRLPYTLTVGVTATREGLVIASDALSELVGLSSTSTGRANLHIWPDAAERLRYREGDPWCQLMNGQPYVAGSHYDPFSDLPTLHRLAAILCDDAEAFRVLHWCVENLGVGE